MKIAVVADSHWNERSRFDECIRIHDWIATDLYERGVDVVLHSGDVYERRSTPDERRAVAEWVRKVTDLAPLVIVRGNHDAIGDLPLLERLRTRFPVRVIETYGQLPIAIDDGVLRVSGLAWPRTGEVLAWARREGAMADPDAIALEALRDVLRGFRERLDGGEEPGPHILLTHAMTRGSRVSTGQPLAGVPLELGVEDLALAGADFIALGHIHLGQDWSFGGVPCVYPGSPRRTAYGESEEKGYVLIEPTLEDDGWKMPWQRIATPATPMLHFACEFVRTGGELVPAWDLEAGATPGIADLAGAEVRLRYRFPADERDAAKEAAGLLAIDARANGAVDVKLEGEPIRRSRAEIPAFAAAVTLADQLRAMWAARAPVTPEREARLLGRVAQLEGKAA